MTDPNTLLFALIGGILPAVLWLVFWLEEDKKRPEPRGLILSTFILGMCATILVLPLEKMAADIFPGLGAPAFIAWATIEEVAKFAAAYIALTSASDDEPIDALIYMIIAALGFVALENALFIVNPLLKSDVAGGIITGHLRFIGASLLHIVSSSAIGASLALSFYKTKTVRVSAVFFGFLMAVFFHTAFNLFILHEDGIGTFLTFGTVWAGITMLFFVFEKVKTLKPLSTENSPSERVRDTIRS